MAGEEEEEKKIQVWKWPKDYIYPKKEEGKPADQEQAEEETVDDICDRCKAQEARKDIRNGKKCRYAVIDAGPVLCNKQVWYTCGHQARKRKHCVNQENCGDDWEPAEEPKNAEKEFNKSYRPVL